MHVLIVGTTLSGKTTLAKKLANQAYNNGRSVLVLDPLLDPDWQNYGCDYITSNVEEFLLLAKKNKNCTLIIDEAGEYCHQYAKQTYWLATQSRHWGHQSIFIAQRANMVSVNIRGNCSTIFCFTQPPDDAKELAKDFCCKSLLESPDMRKGECIYYKRYSNPQKLNIFENNA